MFTESIDKSSVAFPRQLRDLLNSKGVSMLLIRPLLAIQRGRRRSQRRKIEGKGAGPGSFPSPRIRTCSGVFRFKLPPAAPGVESLNLWGRAFRVRPTPTHTHGAHARPPAAAPRTHVFSLPRTEVESREQWRSQYVNQFVPSASPRSEPRR